MRVLMVNYYVVGEDNATGVTLRNIFDGIQHIDLLQYTLNTAVRIDKKRVNGISTVKNKKSNFVNDKIYKMHGETDNAAKKYVATSKSRQVSQLVEYAKGTLLLLNELVPQKIETEILEAIDAFEPEVIYTLGGDINLFKQVLLLSERYSIPIVVHNMDDIYNTKFSGKGVLRRVARIKLRKLYQEVYSRSAKSIAIGPKMATEYEKAFSIPFEFAMNCIDAHRAQNTIKCDGDFLLIFSGGMHGGRADTLCELAKYIETSDLKVHMEIFTSNRDKQQYESMFSSFAKTKVCPFVPKEQQMENLSRADALVHVESFSDENVSYFRLSMSTKLAEYTATGKPIFCIGPKEIATISFIQETNIGVVCENMSMISENISQLIDSQSSAYMKSNVQRVFDEYFYKPNVQKKMLEVFQYNITNYRGSMNDQKR